jgi:hypothetical protein
MPQFQTSSLVSDDPNPRASRRFAPALFVGLLVIAGCNTNPPDPPPPPGPTTLSGTLTGWVGGTGHRVQAQARNASGTATVLGTADVNANGGFTLALPSSVDAALLRPFGGSRTGCTGNVVVSDAEAGTVQAEFELVNASGFVGDALPNLGADQASWTFASKAVRVTGQETCAATTALPGSRVKPQRTTRLRTAATGLTYTFDLNLQAGWNLVTYSGTSDSITARSATGNPAWRIGLENNLGSTPNGADAGSDATHLRGNLGVSSANRLSLEILRRKADQKATVEGVSAAVDANGNFDLTLPAQIETSYLEPLTGLNTDCSNGLTLSDANAQYGELVAAAAKGAMRLGEARALGYAHEINWWFLDRAVTVSGQQVCTVGTAPNTATRTFNFDLTLSAGWNLIVSSQTSKSGDAVTVRGGTIPPGTRWLLAQDDAVDVPGPVGIGGPDAGSTPTNPKGRLGDWKSAQGAPATLEVILANGTSLAQTTIDADGHFNLALPASIDETQLSALDLSVGCNGNLTYNPPDALGEMVYFDPFRAEDQLGWVVAGDDGLEVNWVYVASATTVTGSEVCTDGDGTTDTYTYNLNLASGWNLVASKVTLEGGNLRVNLTNGPLPSGTQWFYERFVDDGEPDRGSTPSLVAGKLSTDRVAHTLEASVLTRDGFPSPVLLETVIGADGSFTLNLPSSIDTTQNALSSLSFNASGCVGTVALSDSSAKTGVLAFELRAPSSNNFVALVEAGGVSSDGKELDLEWWYLDKDATVSGHQTCQGTVQSSERRYDLNLRAGWNLVLHESETDRSGMEVTSSTTVAQAPTDIRWLSY